jgi:hypothetical protein
MTGGEMAYLTMVIVAALTFALALASVSSGSRRR